MSRRPLRLLLAAAPLSLALAALLTARPAPGGAAAGSCEVTPADLALDAEELAALAAVNAYRASLGAGALTLDAVLVRSASWLARDLADGAYLSHEHIDRQGRTMPARLADCGYDREDTWRGEDAGAGYLTGAAIVDGWRASPAHDAILRDGHYTVAGVARARSATAPQGWYWVLDLASAPAAPLPAVCGD